MSGSHPIDIHSLLEEIITLPSPSYTTARMMAVLGNDNCSEGQVASLLSLDPAIAIKVLRVVNSAAYGVREPNGMLMIA